MIEGQNSGFSVVTLEDIPARSETWDGHKARVVVNVEGQNFEGSSAGSSVDHAYAGAFFDALTDRFPVLRSVGLPVADNSQSHTDLSFPVAGSRPLVVRNDGPTTNRHLGEMVALAVKTVVKQLG